MQATPFHHTIAVALIVAAIASSAPPAHATCGQLGQTDFTYSFTPAPGPLSCVSGFCTDGTLFWEVLGENENFLTFSRPNEQGLYPHYMYCGCGLLGCYASPSLWCTDPGFSVDLGTASIAAFVCGGDGHPPCATLSIPVPPDPVGVDCASPFTFCLSEVDFDGDGVIENEDVRQYLYGSCLDRDSDGVLDDANGNGKYEPCSYSSLKTCGKSCDTRCDANENDLPDVDEWPCLNPCYRECLSGCDDNCPNVWNGIAPGPGFYDAQRDENNDTIGDDCQAGWRIACAAGSYVDGTNDHGDSLVNVLAELGEAGLVAAGVPGTAVTIGSIAVAAFGGLGSPGSVYIPPVPTQNYARAQLVYSNEPPSPFRRLTSVKVQVTKSRRGGNKARVGLLVWDLDQPQTVYYRDERTISLVDGCPFSAQRPCDESIPLFGAASFKTTRALALPTNARVQATVLVRFKEGEKDRDPWCSMSSPLGGGGATPDEEYPKAQQTAARTLIEPYFCKNILKNKVSFGKFAEIGCGKYSGLNCSAHPDGDTVTCFEKGAGCDLGTCGPDPDVSVPVCSTRAIVNGTPSWPVVCEGDPDCQLGQCIESWRDVCLQGMGRERPVWRCNTRVDIGLGLDAATPQVARDGRDACVCGGYDLDVLPGAHLGISSYNNWVVYPRPPSALGLLPYDDDWLGRGAGSSAVSDGTGW